MVTKAVFADPSTTVKYLMSDPISRWDWGMYRLEQFIRENLPREKEKFILQIDYDWNKNRIYIAFTPGESDASNTNEAREKCRNTLNRLKDFLGINPETGKPNPILITSGRIGDFFLHKGYSLTSEPQDLWEEIDRITVLSSTVSIKSELNKYVRCECPLLGKEVLFSE
jgi:hypothetical protein